MSYGTTSHKPTRELSQGDRIRGIGLTVASMEPVPNQPGAMLVKGTLSSRDDDGTFQEFETSIVVPAGHTLRIRPNAEEYGSEEAEARAPRKFYETEIADNAPADTGDEVDYNSMTTKELLKLPQAAQISGRHKMTKGGLVAALEAL